MNDLATRNDNIPTTHDAADYFTDFGNQATMRSIVGKLLKFSKGDYMAGENNEDIAEGTELLVNMDTFTTGWIKWKDNKPEEQVMGLLCEGFQPPKRNMLDSTDETEWELDENNRPRDPWQFTVQVLLKEPGGEELFTFSTSSRGGVSALGEMAKIYGKHRRIAPDEMPVVALNVGSYMHSNKAYGKIKFPIFEVKGWASKAEFADAQGSLSLAPNESAAAASANTKF